MAKYRGWLFRTPCPCLRELFGPLRCPLWDSSGLGERNEGFGHRQLEGCNSDRAAAGFGSIFSLQPLLNFYYSLNKPFDRSEVCVIFNTEI